MKTLTAQVKTANFTDLNDSNCKNSYPVHVFENGLVLIPSLSTNDYFFYCQENIEGNGHDVFKNLNNSEEIVEYSSLALVQTWGNSCAEFGVDKQVLLKIKELIKN